MRVIAGTYGGRRLAAVPGTGTRPTSDRVREALFSILGPLDGVRVLDLFAGTGALGIEALSRGARQATFVERDRRALAVLRSNLDALDLPAGVADVRPREALAALREAHGRGEAYDLALLDPPYRLAAGLGGQLDAPLGAVLASGARVVCESDRRAPLRLAGLVTRTERRYGDTVVEVLDAP